MIVKKGTADIAPEYESSIYGKPIWSGKHISELTPEMIASMQSFIEHEGKRRGYDDSASRNVGMNEKLFHPDFLKGWAHTRWVEFYQEGVREETLGLKSSEVFLLAHSA